MSATDILRAALEEMETFVYSPMPEIMWPGIPGDPPATGLWLVFKYFPNDEKNIAWGDASCVESRGHFKILVYFRPGEGTVNPTDLADELIRHFQKGLQLGPVRVSKRAWQTLPVTEDSSKIFIPVTIPYLGLTS